jgi:hypothetical protein
MGAMHRVRITVAMVVALVVLVLLALSSLEAVHAAEQQRSTTRSLERARAAEARTWRVETAHVTATQRQANSLSRSLEVSESQLYATQSSLIQERDTVFDQGLDITALNTCLGGVEAALNELSVGDDQGAVTSLSQVRGSCDDARS